MMHHTDECMTVNDFKHVYSIDSDEVPVIYHQFMYDNINTQYIYYNINISSTI